MFVHERMLSRALRRFTVLVVLAIAAALLPAALLGPAEAAPAGAGSQDPPGNNGTVKIVEDGDFDSIPNNDPHVGCVFTVEWYGFDKGADIVSKVKFEMQSPTGSVGLTVDGPSTVFVGGDPASGAGTATGLDGRQAYTLTFDGPPHPIQGYHVKLTIATPGSQGNDKKYKVFWVEGCDPVQPPTPGISLEKSVTDSNDADSTGSLGETLTYAFSVTNTGNVPLTDVTISDAKLGMVNVACVATLAVGETKSCPPKSYVVTAADIAHGSVHNTATAAGKPPTGPNVTDDDDATIPTPAKPAIVVDKTVADSNDADTVASLGETLTYTFTVTNTGNVPLTNIKISDPKLGMSNVACVASLAVGASFTCPTKTYVVTAADVAEGKVYNVATAKGTPPTGDDVTDDDDANIPTQTNSPAIDLEKSVVDSNDADQVGSLGETLTYTFVVTNTGNVPLTNVRISDPKLAMANVFCVANLAVGASATCPQKAYVVTAADIATGSVHNTATAAGTPPTGPDVTAQDDATIGTPADPSIHLEKSVADSNDADSLAGPGEVLTYTFVVTNTGNVPLTDVTISDPKLSMSNVFCVANLAVGASATCPVESYTATSGDIAAGSISNTATATGTPPSGPDVSDEDDATICTAAAMPMIFLDKQVFDSNDADQVGSLGEVLTYTFDVTNTGNVDLTDVTITDPMFGLADAPCVAFLAVGDTTDCPLLPAQSHTVDQDDVNHGSVDNTATTSGTPPTGPDVTDDDTANMPVPGPGGNDDDVDLVVDKSSDASIAGPGDQVTYTINVRNLGGGDALDVVVTDTLPQGTTYVSSSAPCTYASGIVTCHLGTIEADDDATVTITVKVNASGNSGGNTQHQHHLDYTKVESHVSAFSGETTGTTQCPTGYVATDGSVRLDHVDQGAGTFEDVDVVKSAVTADGKGWTGTVRNNTSGQVQAKVMVVCATEKTTSGEDHAQPLVITGPSSSTQIFGPGRHTVDLNCAAGSYPIQPSHVLTAGSAVVGTHRTTAGWQFIVDVDTSATGTFSVHCLSSALGTVSGHSHDLVFAELSDTVTVPAGQTVERKLTCADGYKGIVAWADIDPGLVSLGNDPQPITRVFKFYNPTSGPLSARFGLLCVAIRTQGEDHPGDSQVTNTASAATSSHDVNASNNSDSATITVSPTGVTVTPRASVVSNAGKTSVQLGLATGSKRAVTLKLLATGKVAGLKGGAVLAQGKATLKAGKGSVRLVAKGAAAKALKSGKVGKATLVVISKGHKDVRVIKLR